MMDEITSAVLNIDGDHIDGKVLAENDINNLYVFQSVMKALYFDAEIWQRKVRGRANFFGRSVSLVTNIGGSFS